MYIRVTKVEHVKDGQVKSKQALTSMGEAKKIFQAAFLHKMPCHNLVMFPYISALLGSRLSWNIST